MEFKDLPRSLQDKFRSGQLGLGVLSSVEALALERYLRTHAFAPFRASHAQLKPRFWEHPYRGPPIHYNCYSSDPFGLPPEPACWGLLQSIAARFRRDMREALDEEATERTLPAGERTAPVAWSQLEGALGVDIRTFLNRST